MATRTSSNLIVTSFAGYYGGWAPKNASDSSGYYFGTGSSYGPLCIKFKIPSINNFLNRNPTVTFSFKANGVGYYTTCSFTATIRTSNYSSNSTSAQGTAVSKAVKQSMSIPASSFSSSPVTTSAITITGSSVKADNSTYYYCWFTSPSGNYQVKEITGKVYYDAYTQCSAPTTVQFKYGGVKKPSPYTHPSDNGTSGIEITWSGAKAGAGMNIKGYKIQRYDSETGSWDKYDTLVDSSFDSYTLAAGVRGKVRTYRIITRGSVDGYDSAASSAVYIYFNSKPTAPEGSDLIVKSTAEAAEIPITIPVTNYSYKTNTRTMTLWYRSGEEGEWKNSGEKSESSAKKTYYFSVSGSEMPTEGAPQDYYFKMIDSFKDESDVLKITLTRSVSLDISSFAATLTDQSEGKMKVSFSTDTSAHKDSIEIELMSGGESIASATVPWKDSINLLTEGPAYNGSMTLTYKFTLKASDDFGDSVSKEAATYLNSGDTVEQDIRIGALPNDVTLYNTLTGESLSITEVEGLRYFQNIRAEFDPYTLMTSNAALYIGDSSIQYAPSIETNAFKFALNENEILNKLTTSALKGRIDFSFSLGTKITNSFSKTIYFSPRPNISIVPPFSTFKMYDQGTGIFQINGAFDGFGLKGIKIKGMNEVSYEVAALGAPDTAGYKISGFNLGDLFPITSFNAKEERKGTISKTITLVATNSLGVTQTAQTTITLDFRKTPNNIAIGTITYGDGTLSNLGTTLLCEGTKIQVPFTYTSYGGDSIRFSICFDEVEKASTIATPTGAETTNGTNQSEALSFTVPIIPFGKTVANIIIKANLVGATETNSSEDKLLKLSPYEDPGMSILSSELSEKKLTLNYSLNAQGGGTYNYDLQFEENNEWTSKVNQDSPSPFVFGSAPSANQVARIKITYTYPSGTTRAADTRISYSNTFVIFAEGPTVSYRKNYLGINSPSPEEKCVIDINSSTGRNKIKFSSPAEAVIELVASSNGPQLIFTKKGTNNDDIVYTFTFDS